MYEPKKGGVFFKSLWPFQQKNIKRRAPGFKYIDACQGEIASSFFTEREREKKQVHTHKGGEPCTHTQTQKISPLFFSSLELDKVDVPFQERSPLKDMDEQDLQKKKKKSAWKGNNLYSSRHHQCVELFIMKTNTDKDQTAAYSVATRLWRHFEEKKIKQQQVRSSPHHKEKKENQSRF